MPSILVFVLFFAGVYFLLLRPQQQRVRRQRELITAIGVGDRVVTAGGLIGRVVDVNDERLLLEVADGVVVELLRLAISRRLDDSEAISDSVFGSSATSDTLEEAYAADDYVADDEAADPETAADAADPETDADAADPEAGADVDADVEADPEADVAADGESTEVSEAGSASEAGPASEAGEVSEASEAGSGSAPETVPPASAGGAAVPGVPVSPSTGVVGTDGTIQEAGPPAPRQDPH
ncbi:MAG: preprotein translocase subunit YajC [Acidimicrobiaceae bacterium]|nr:preprotein translocase subunit YajC [Acidimicrobiaceae bacterium]